VLIILILFRPEKRVFCRGCGCVRLCGGRFAAFVHQIAEKTGSFCAPALIFIAKIGVLPIVELS
jgi:hypothetical protein